MKREIDMSYRRMFLEIGFFMINDYVAVRVATLVAKMGDENS